MTRKVDVDALIRDTAVNNWEDFAFLAPDFEQVEQGAIRRTGTPKWFSSVPLRTVMVLAVIFVAFTLGGILRGNASVQAFRHRALVMWNAFAYNGSTEEYDGQAVLCTNETLEQVQKKVPFPIPVPNWLPEGFTFDEAQLVDDANGIYNITLLFQNGRELILVHYSNSDGQGGASAYGSQPHEKVMAGNCEVHLRRAQNKDEYSSASFIYGNSLITHISVPYSVDIESLKKLILSIR